MIQYIIKRLLQAIPIIIGVVLVVFILTTIVPGDPARILSGQRGDPETIAKLRKELGLDLPWYIQLKNFYVDVFTFDLGFSYRNNMPVVQAIAERLPITVFLTITSMIISVIFGMLFGIISATKQYSLADYACMVFAMLGISSPTFFVGLLLVLIFCVNLGWIPGTGLGDWQWEYLVLPVLTLGVRPLALIARLTRSSMLEIIRQDYITTARAKGLKEKVVVYKHALKNALIPVVTVVGLQTAALLGGVMITETIFSLPGVGRLSVQAVINRDFPIIRGVVLFMALAFVLANLIVDISYAFLDPRIRYD